MDRKRRHYSPTRDPDQSRKGHKKTTNSHDSYSQDQEERHQEEKREMREHMLREHVSNNPNKGPWAAIGKDVKVVQCWGCKDYGHRSGDKECRLSKEGARSTEIFRFDHEDPMHKYFEERKRKEKEERVEQLKLLLEDSSTDSDRSSSHGNRRDKHKKCKKRKKKDTKSEKDKDILEAKKNRDKRKKAKTGKKNKTQKKKRLKSSVTCLSENSNDVDIDSQKLSSLDLSVKAKPGAATFNCDKHVTNKRHEESGTSNFSKEVTTFGPSTPNVSSDIEALGLSRGHVESIRNDFSDCRSQNTIKVDNDMTHRPVVCESDLQKELKRFRIESLQLKGQAVLD